MHDSLAVAAFLQPSLLQWRDFYIDVETAGELTAGETVGYSPTAGDLRRTPEKEKEAAMNMSIRGSAPTLASRRTSPVIRDKFAPNANVAIGVDTEQFFRLLIGRLSGQTV
jgi:inosine-uridine nucleoside N-ribohydrolase